MARLSVSRRPSSVAQPRQQGHDTVRRSEETAPPDPKELQHAERSFTVNGRTTGILGLLLVGLFATQNWAAEATADVANETTVKKVRSVEGITEFELENGLRVLLLPDPSRPTVTVNLTILVGSRHEGYGEAGMAHLLEHMVFKGTPLHPNVPKALQDRGAQFNGTTSIDRTNYYETLPASDDNLEFAIRLEADRMINSESLLRGTCYQRLRVGPMVMLILPNVRARICRSISLRVLAFAAQAPGVVRHR